MVDPTKAGASEKAVFSTFETIESWRQTIRNAFVPQQHSELWADDQDWPHFPTSTVAWVGLASTVDHLDAIKRHLQARVLFSFAHLTLCRSALIGAAQAVWILGPPDSHTRIKRSRTVTADMYRKHLKYIEGLQEQAETPHIGTDTVATTLTELVHDLGEKRNADGQRSDLDTTKMIEEAADLAFGQPKLTREAILCWRSSSGAAHGFFWQFFGTVGTAQTKLAGDDGLAEFQTGGSLERMSNGYLAAYQIARQGWALLNQRGSNAPRNQAGGG
ncbi:MAG: hypothetical protein WBZ15_13700 [Mycobacterium sp.]|uniref:hypothetical protein n=1 Tax=Mycobacterium sp. TaxID=1785 RepID=UPI003C65B3E1